MINTRAIVRPAVAAVASLAALTTFSAPAQATIHPII